MKRFIIRLSLFAMSLAIGVVACSEYDDSDIKSDISDLQSRVSALEEIVENLQSEMISIQTIVSAISSGDWIVSVTSFSEDNSSGYYITFNSLGTITIYNGADGADGYTPVISVTMIDGIYYWVIDGTILTDSSGNPIAVSPDDGSEGVTPLLKIDDNGDWYYSVDGGSSWNYLSDGLWGSTAESDSLFASVEQDDEYVYFTLLDGTILTVCKGTPFTISLSSYAVQVAAGSSVSVDYTLVGGDSSTIIRTYAQDGYTATVNPSDTLSGIITIVAPTESESSTDIMVFISDGGQKFYMASISVNGTQAYIFTVESIDNFSYEGGSTSFTITSYNTVSQNVFASPWTIEFVEELEEGEYSVISRPDWLTISLTSGEGGLAGDIVNLIVEAQEAQDLNDHDNNLKSATAVNNYDLSTKGGSTSINTANCYIVNSAGTYSLPLVYGNAIVDGETNEGAYTASVTGTYILSQLVNHRDTVITSPYIYENYGCTPAGATLLWEDVDGLVTDVAIDADSKNLTFSIPSSTIAQGNAVVAVLDADGVIMWSWHIWVTDYVPELDASMDDLNRDKVVYNNSSMDFTIMPINLGWCFTEETHYDGREVLVRVTQVETSDTFVFTVTQDEKDIWKGNNTFYQWGRKDPLVGGICNSEGESVQKNYWTGDESYSYSIAATGVTIGESIQNPLTCYAWNLGTNAWWQDSPYSNLWRNDDSTGALSNTVITSSDKTIYDPSPVGYSVPPYGTFSGTTLSGSMATSMSSVNTLTATFDELSSDEGSFFFCNPQTSSGSYDTEGGSYHLSIPGFYSSDGEYYSKGYCVYYWTASYSKPLGKVSPAGKFACCLVIQEGIISPVGGFCSSYGGAIRPTRMSE